MADKCLKFGLSELLCFLDTKIFVSMIILCKISDGLIRTLRWRIKEKEENEYNHTFQAIVKHI